MVHQGLREGKRLLDQQEVPAFPAHHVPPGDALKLAPRCCSVVDRPDVLEELADAAEGAAISGIAKAGAALCKHAAEGSVGGRAGASDEERPGDAAIETIRSFRDVVHELAELGEQVAAAW